MSPEDTCRYPPRNSTGTVWCNGVPPPPRSGPGNPAARPQGVLPAATHRRPSWADSFRIFLFFLSPRAAVHRISIRCAPEILSWCYLPHQSVHVCPGSDFGDTQQIVIGQFRIIGRQREPWDDFFLQQPFVSRTQSREEIRPRIH